MDVGLGFADRDAIAVAFGFLRILGFYIYRNLKQIKKGIQLNNRKLVNTILYADGHILMATSEDDLQTMAHRLNLIARKYKLTISSKKQNQC